MRARAGRRGSNGACLPFTRGGAPESPIYSGPLAGGRTTRSLQGAPMLAMDLAQETGDGPRALRGSSIVRWRPG